MAREDRPAGRDGEKQFWLTPPGITAIATLLGALGGLLVVLNQIGVIGGGDGTTAGQIEQTTVTEEPPGTDPPPTTEPPQAAAETPAFADTQSDPAELVKVSGSGRYDSQFELALPTNRNAIPAEVASDCFATREWMETQQAPIATPNPEGRPYVVEVTAQGTARLGDVGAAAAIVDLTVDIEDWNPPVAGIRVGCEFLPATNGVAPVVVAKVTLPPRDGSPPEIVYFLDDVELDTFPRQDMKGGDSIFFAFEIDATSCHCVWTGVLHVIIDGKPVEFPITDELGQPFRVTGPSASTAVSVP